MTAIKHILAIMAVLLCGAGAMAQNSDFERIARIPNVEYVYISKSMLKSLEPLDSAGELSFIHSTKDLNSIEILSCDDAENVAEVKSMLADATDDLELLSKVKSGQKNIDVYGKRQGDGLSEMMVISPTAEKVVAVFIKGYMDAETLKSIAEMKQ